jgi:hypothetical protein
MPTKPLKAAGAAAFLLRASGPALARRLRNPKHIEMKRQKQVRNTSRKPNLPER